MNDARDTPEAALAAALRRTYKSDGWDSPIAQAAAILAAMPDWRLVPDDTSLAYDTGFQDGLLEATEIHRADAVPVDAGERHPEGCESCARPTTETGRRILAQFHGWPERPEYPWNLLDANDILAIEDEARAVPVDAERLRAALRQIAVWPGDRKLVASICEIALAPSDPD